MLEEHRGACRSHVRLPPRPAGKLSPRVIREALRLGLSWVDGRGAYKVLKGGSLAFADGSSLGWQRAGGWQQREEAKEAGGGGA